jgi:NitT/TauT family transport system substrate-binding protein
MKYLNAKSRGISSRGRKNPVTKNPATSYLVSRNPVTKTQAIGHRWQGLIACVLLGLLAACSEQSGPDGASSDLQQVTFNMSWLPQGSMAGVMVAIDKGYYRERGIAVETTRGFGGIRTVNELDQGMFEFGYGDPLAVILNRSNGGKTRMVGAINQRWPAGLCYVAERHDVSTPADLQGMVVGGGQNSPVQAIVPAWLEANGLARDTVTMMQLDPSVISASLIEGKIDAGECWLGNSLAVYQKRAREAGLTIGTIEYSDFNLDIYGNGLVTTDRLIAEQPQLVADFVAATYQGYDYARAHQEEATDIMLKYFPVLDRAVTAQQVAEISELISVPGTLGGMQEAKVSNTLQFLAAAYEVDESLTAADIYTDRFLGSPVAASPQ